MNSFPAQWINGICLALNEAGIEMPKDKGGGRWEPTKFENSIELMKDYITFSRTIYEFLNSKSLINRGYCPITGEKIGTENYYKIFGRKVYISQEGERIAKEWDRKEHVRVFGKEPLTEEDKLKTYKDFREKRPKTPLVYWLFLAAVILYFIKKCS